MSCPLRGFLVISLGVALASCAAVAPPQSPTGTPGVEAHEDSPHRFITFVGAKAQHAPPFLGIPETNFYCLRSFVDRRTGETAHQVYVSDSYFGSERGWNAARDSAGSPLQFVQISHDEISCDLGCSYVEEFAAILPESKLRASPGGLSVTFLSPSGAEKTIVISGDTIAAQLAAIAARRNLVVPAAARAGPAPPG